MFVFFPQYNGHIEIIFHYGQAGHFHSKRAVVMLCLTSRDLWAEGHFHSWHWFIQGEEGRRSHNWILFFLLLLRFFVTRHDVRSFFSNSERKITLLQNSHVPFVPDRCLLFSQALWCWVPHLQWRGDEKHAGSAACWVEAPELPVHTWLSSRPAPFALQPRRWCSRRRELVSQSPEFIICERKTSLKTALESHQDSNRTQNRIIHINIKAKKSRFTVFKKKIPLKIAVLVYISFHTSPRIWDETWLSRHSKSVHTVMTPMSETQLHLNHL